MSKSKVDVNKIIEYISKLDIQGDKNDFRNSYIYCLIKTYELSTSNQYDSMYGISNLNNSFTIENDEEYIYKELNKLHDHLVDECILYTFIGDIAKIHTSITFEELNSFNLNVLKNYCDIVGLVDISNNIEIFLNTYEDDLENDVDFDVVESVRNMSQDISDSKDNLQDISENRDMSQDITENRDMSQDITENISQYTLLNKRISYYKDIYNRKSEEFKSKKRTILLDLLVWKFFNIETMRWHNYKTEVLFNKRVEPFKGIGHFYDFDLPDSIVTSESNYIEMHYPLVGSLTEQNIVDRFNYYELFHIAALLCQLSGNNVTFTSEMTLKDLLMIIFDSIDELKIDPRVVLTPLGFFEIINFPLNSIRYSLHRNNTDESQLITAASLEYINYQNINNLYILYVISQFELQFFDTLEDHRVYITACRFFNEKQLENDTFDLLFGSKDGQSDYIPFNWDDLIELYETKGIYNPYDMITNEDVSKWKNLSLRVLKKFSNIANKYSIKKYFKMLLLEEISHREHIYSSISHSVKNRDGIDHIIYLYDDILGNIVENIEENVIKRFFLNLYLFGKYIVDIWSKSLDVSPQTADLIISLTFRKDIIDVVYNDAIKIRITDELNRLHGLIDENQLLGKLSIFEDVNITTMVYMLEECVKLSIVKFINLSGKLFCNISKYYYYKIYGLNIDEIELNLI